MHALTTPIEIMNQQYCLAPHVYFCRAGAHIIILDLKRDRYVGLDGAAAKALSAHIADLPLTRASDDADMPHDDSSHGVNNELLQQMVANGIVQPCNLLGVTHQRPLIMRANVALIEGYTEQHPRVQLIDILRFLRAFIIAYLLLKFRSLEQITRRVQGRRIAQSKAQQQLKSHELITHRLKEIVLIFSRLRPLLFTANSECVFNSLALCEFLASYGLYPTWVFGVSTEPFRAHCWLQHRKVVVDDTPDNVNNYEPIMEI